MEPLDTIEEVCGTGCQQCHERIREVHSMLMSLAEAMSHIGESPGARAMMKTLGFAMPKVDNGNGKHR